MEAIGLLEGVEGHAYARLGTAYGRACASKYGKLLGRELATLHVSLAKWYWVTRNWEPQERTRPGWGHPADAPEGQ